MSRSDSGEDARRTRESRGAGRLNPWVAAQMNDRVGTESRLRAMKHFVLEPR